MIMKIFENRTDLRLYLLYIKTRIKSHQDYIERSKIHNE